MTQNFFNQFIDFLMYYVNYFLDFRIYVFTDSSMYFTPRFILIIFFCCVIISLLLSLINVSVDKGE